MRILLIVQVVDGTAFRRCVEDSLRYILLEERKGIVAVSDRDRCGESVMLQVGTLLSLSFSIVLRCRALMRLTCDGTEDGMTGVLMLELGGRDSLQGCFLGREGRYRRDLGVGKGAE